MSFAKHLETERPIARHEAAPATAIARLCMATFVATVMFSAACEDTRTPTLCVFHADELDGTTFEQIDDCARPDTDMDGGQEARCPDAVTEGDVLFVRHELPGGIDAPGPVSLAIETPCVTSTFDVPYVDSVALWSGTAPSGSACALTVTAVVANSELRCTTTTADSSLCTDIVCPEN